MLPVAHVSCTYEGFSAFSMQLKKNFEMKLWAASASPLGPVNYRNVIFLPLEEPEFDSLKYLNIIK